MSENRKGALWGDDVEKKEKLMCGERLRALRIRKGLTQEETSERLDISLRYYQMLERGEKIGSIDVLIAASDLLDCSLDYLLRGRVGEMPANPLAAKLDSLTPRQRFNAARLLDLWIESLEEN